MKKINTLYGVINLQQAIYSEVGIGLSANTILLLFHVLTFLLQHRPRPTDLIIALLALIHAGKLVLMIFISTDVFAPQSFWDDIMCKALAYLERVLRSLSICATCLLSILQAVTLSPRSSHLAKFKHKSPYHSLCFLLLLWVYYMCFSGVHMISSIVNSNLTSQGPVFLTESCIILPMSDFLRALLSVLGIARDVLLTGFMALSSGYMVTLLLRHKRQSQHLRRPGFSPKASPEQRATQTILLLLSCFMILYCLDSLVFHSRLMRSNDPIRHGIQMMLANGYAAISPLVFLTNEKRIIHFCKSLGRLKPKCTTIE